MALDVLMVCPYDLSVPGGVQNQAMAMSRELVRRGHHVGLFSPGSRVDDALVNDGIHHLVAGSVRSVAANGSNAPITVSYGRVRAASEAIELAANAVIHIHEPIAPVMAWPLLARHRRAMVATLHRSGVDRVYRMAGTVLKRRLDHLDAVCSVSEAARRTGIEAMGLDSEVLFNGVDLHGIEVATPWTKAGPTVMFVGRNEPRKGRDVLLEAAALLPETVTLWVTGDAPDGFASRGARVEFLGVIDEAEKASRLRAADVLCAPSLGGESFGIVLIEGLAASCAVVASDIDGYRQALSGHGILVEPSNPSALAQAISSAVAFDSASREAGKTYAATWSIANLVTSYEAIYDTARSRFGRRETA
jgi:phosphatidyl-myo-inositol alpha-mannosyltransferase